jgi:hypothetical protein
MRVTLTVLSFGLIALAVFLALHSDARRANARETSSAASPVKHDFEREIKPIFQARCQPCHFQGGKVYDRMPFDKPATITRLGTKLFTRIKDEKEQKLIREFLADN